MRSVFSLMMIVLFFSCSSRTKETYNMIEMMRTSPVTIPYDQMNSWQNDSLRETPPWKNSKLVLVHYIDSTMCSSCYLRKICMIESTFKLEEKTNNEFRNLYIINPDKKAKNTLAEEYSIGLIPRTIFVDTANVFLQVNPHIPLEKMYHTFLIDENNCVILVGDPYSNEKLMDMLLSIIENRLGIKV